MATLTVTALDVSGSPLNGEPVNVSLCDVTGQALREFTAEGLLVTDVLGYTNSSGVCVLDIVPNEDVVRQNTYYEVTVGHKPPILIEKSSGPQSLLQALATSPIALGPAATLESLGDVDLTGLQVGQAIQWDGDKWIPVDWVEGGGGGGAPAAHATSHISGADQLSDATGSAHGLMTAAQFSKLAGVATGATANSTDAQLRDRSTHTGTQAHTTITGLGTAATSNTGDFEPAGSVAAVVAGAPSNLNTLDEIAAAISDDPAFSVTLASAMALKADDSGVVHNTGAETVAGIKTFSSSPAVPDNSFTTAKTAGLVSALAALQPLAAALTQISGLTFSANDVIQSVGGVLTNRTMAQLKTALAIAQGDVSGLTAALAALQPLDADLTAIAAISPSNDDVIQRKAGAWVNRTMAQLYTDLLAAGLTTALAGKQDLDADLTAIAALTPTNGNVIKGNGTAWTSAAPSGGAAVGMAQARITAGDITLPNTSSVWTLVSSGSPGVPQLTIAAVVGDRIEVNVNCLSSSANNYFDVVVVTGAGPTIQRYMASGSGTPATEGNPGFYPALVPMPGPQYFTAASGDIDTGVIRFRLAHISSSATRTLYASSSYPFYWQVKNFGQ